MLILTGHFGNWEVATVAGIGSYPEVRGRFHFVRRPIKPRWLDAFVTRRFERAGFGVIAKRGSLDAIVDAASSAGDVVVFPFDQYAGRADGIDVEFFGQPAGTFKSLAIIALATAAPVMPAASWRETSSVWPSGVARATDCAAIIAAAPGLFSTSTAWPNAAFIGSCEQPGDNVDAAAGRIADDQADVLRSKSTLGACVVSSGEDRSRGGDRESASREHVIILRAASVPGNPARRPGGR